MSCCSEFLGGVHSYVVDEHPIGVAVFLERIRQACNGICEGGYMGFRVGSATGWPTLNCVRASEGAQPPSSGDGPMPSGADHLWVNMRSV